MFPKESARNYCNLRHSTNGQYLLLSIAPCSLLFYSNPSFGCSHFPNEEAFPPAHRLQVPESVTEMSAIFSSFAKDSLLFNFLSRKNTLSVCFYFIKSCLIKFLFPSDFIISHPPNFRIIFSILRRLKLSAVNYCIKRAKC
mgnify:FL=1